MTIGIYALYWEEQDLIYIGQSQDIDTRFKEHIRKLETNKHSNYKVQDAFITHGAPQLIVLEECSLNYLNDLEILWTTEFNSINSGLNIIEAGKVGFGTNSNNSKYSKLQILKVFRQLCFTTLTAKQIAYNIAVNKSLVEGISAQQIHIWLREVYPWHYHIMNSNLDRKNNKFNNSKQGSKKGKYPTLINTISGEIKEILYIKEFCTEFFPETLYSSGKAICKVLNGHQQIYRGWKIYSTLY